MKFYVYILYSNDFDIYYIGHTKDVFKRLDIHNNSEKNTFTSKYRPWELKAVFFVSEERSDAMKLEQYIKEQKSRSILIKLIDTEFEPTGKLAQLVRVPHMRN